MVNVILVTMGLRWDKMCTVDKNNIRKHFLSFEKKV